MQALCSEAVIDLLLAGDHTSPPRPKMVMDSPKLERDSAKTGSVSPNTHTRRRTI
jgi:hypothetical protein